MTIDCCRPFNPQSNGVPRDKLELEASRVSRTDRVQNFRNKKPPENGGGEKEPVRWRCCCV